jgi:hypothetical protein
MDGRSQRKGYALALLLGAFGGGLFVALATRAVPNMMGRMMTGMMRNMMDQMKEGGASPSEM